MLTDTAVFPLLKDPLGYVACGLDLGVDARRRAYWLELFRGHFPSLLAEAKREAASRGLDQAQVQARCAGAGEAFACYLDQLTQDPHGFGRLDILAICLERERVLRGFGFDDPYRLAKQEQNDAALALLAGVLAQIDAMEPRQRVVRLIEGVFAGNIFDLGVSPTLELFEAGGLDFHATLSRLKPRPWRVDHLDAWVHRWRDGQPYQQAVLFVDNAGFDIVLGMIPLARELLRGGAGVILTANSTASLNDITHAELTGLIGSIAGWDTIIGQALAGGRLKLIPSGNGAPLIDLTRCSPQLADAVERCGPDLVVLEGMGRALETNFDAPLACDTLKIAMIKDAGVAEVYGGEVFDLVFRFDQVGR